MFRFQKICISIFSLLSAGVDSVSLMVEELSEAFYYYYYLYFARAVLVANESVSNLKLQPKTFSIRSYVWRVLCMLLDAIRIEIYFHDKNTENTE